MRKSKLFLTGALLVAAIAGVAATKGMKAPRAQYYYQKGNVCQLVEQTILCQPGQPVCKFTDAAGTYQIYGQRVTPALCQQPLQPE